MQFLRKKCTEGLGASNFEKALVLLKAMQEGDCKVSVEGVEYDGNDDDQVCARHKPFLGAGVYGPAIAVLGGGWGASYWNRPYCDAA